MTTNKKNATAAKNSNGVAKVTKNVVTNNVATSVAVDTVELDAKTAKNIALGSALSELGEYGTIEEQTAKTVSGYDEYKKTTYLEALKSRWLMPELTLAQKLVKGYDDRLACIDYDCKDIGLTPDLARALGPGRCLTLWFNALPKKKGNEVRKVLNYNYKGGGYEYVAFDDFLKIVNDNYKDLLNILGYRDGVTREDISVNGAIVAWSVLNDDGKKTLHESGLYYRKVANDVGGWCAALSSLDIVTKYRMRVALNKIDDNKYSRTNIVNFLKLALQSGVDVGTLKVWCDSACDEYTQKIAKDEADYKTKTQNRIDDLRKELHATDARYNTLVGKKEYLDKFAKVLDDLRAAANNNKYAPRVIESCKKRVLQLGALYPTAYAAKLPGLIKSALKRYDKLAKDIAELEQTIK